MPTVEDTRIDEIGKIILDHRYKKDPRDMNALKYSSYLIAKKILEYFAPIIEKAEKWDKLTAITADNDCKGCPVDKLCESQRYCIVEYILLSAEKVLEGGKDDRP